MGKKSKSKPVKKTYGAGTPPNPTNDPILQAHIDRGVKCPDIPGGLTKANVAAEMSALADKGALRFPIGTTVLAAFKSGYHFGKVVKHFDLSANAANAYRIKLEPVAGVGVHLGTMHAPIEVWAPMDIDKYVREAPPFRPRFNVEQEVEACCKGSFVKGKVIKVWDEGNAYRIRIHETQSDVWAKEDRDNFVRLPHKVADFKQPPTVEIRPIPTLREDIDKVVSQACSTPVNPRTNKQLINGIRTLVGPRFYLLPFLHQFLASDKLTCGIAYALYNTAHYPRPWDLEEQYNETVEHKSRYRRVKHWNDLVDEYIKICFVGGDIVRHDVVQDDEELEKVEVEEPTEGGKPEPFYQQKLWKDTLPEGKEKMIFFPATTYNNTLYNNGGPADPNDARIKTRGIYQDLIFAFLESPEALAKLTASLEEEFVTTLSAKLNDDVPSGSLAIERTCKADYDFERLFRHCGYPTCSKTEGGNFDRHFAADGVLETDESTELDRTKFSLCSGCQRVAYCCKAHQRAHWRDHHDQCGVGRHMPYCELVSGYTQHLEAFTAELVVNIVAGACQKEGAAVAITTQFNMLFQ